MDNQVSTPGSVYALTPKAARIMNQGRVPGAVVTDDLLQTVQTEWQDKQAGRTAAIERAARPGAVLKGLGYRGTHLGGIHRDFATVGLILDRMAVIDNDWQEFIPEFNYPRKNGFYAFRRSQPDLLFTPVFGRKAMPLPIKERFLYPLMQSAHNLFSILILFLHRCIKGYARSWTASWRANFFSICSSIPSNACCWAAGIAGPAPSSMSLSFARSRAAPNTPATGPAAAAATACARFTRIGPALGLGPTFFHLQPEKSNRCATGAYPRACGNWTTPRPG
jgi:hypothetical protein